MAESDKKALRTHFLSLRSSVSPEERVRRDASLVSCLQQFACKRDFRQIFLYQPFRAEPNLLPLIECMRDVLFALPVIKDVATREMVFVPMTQETVLTPNSWGILEPSYTVGQEVLPTQHTLVVVPALAIDRHGVRLGYGGGFYDQYVAGLGRDQRPTFLAAVYEAFFTESLPHEGHDMQIDFVITETGLHQIARDDILGPEGRS